MYFYLSVDIDVLCFMSYCHEQFLTFLMYYTVLLSHERCEDEADSSNLLHFFDSLPVEQQDCRYKL